MNLRRLELDGVRFSTGPLSKLLEFGQLYEFPVSATLKHLDVRRCNDLHVLSLLLLFMTRKRDYTYRRSTEPGISMPSISAADTAVICRLIRYLINNYVNEENTDNYHDDVSIVVKDRRFGGKARIINAMEIVTAISGASGALYAQRFIQGLVAAGVNVHLVVSPWGRRLLRDAEMRISEDGEKLGPRERAKMEKPSPRITEADEKKDLKRLDRALDQTLYLVVKDAKGWAFPTTDVLTSEALHEVCWPKFTPGYGG